MRSFLEFVLLLEDQGTLNRLKKKYAAIEHSHDFGMMTHVVDKVDKDIKAGRVPSRQEASDPEYHKAYYKAASGHIIDHLATFDDSQTKKNTEFLVKQYQQKHIRSEDLNAARQTLNNFERLKHRLPANKRNLYDQKTYPRIHDVRETLEPFLEGAKSKNVDDWDRIKKEGTEEIYNNKKGLRVVKLKTKEASCALYGKPKTQWCTAWEGENHFDSYSRKGPLYVIHTPDNRMYQLHFQTDQLKDEEDKEVDNRKDFIKAHPDLQKVKEFHNEENYRQYPSLLKHFVPEEKQIPILKKWVLGSNDALRNMAIKDGGDKIHAHALAHHPDLETKKRIAISSENRYHLLSLAADSSLFVRQLARKGFEETQGEHLAFSTARPGSEDHLLDLIRHQNDYEEIERNDSDKADFMERHSNHYIYIPQKRKELDAEYLQHFPTMAKDLPLNAVRQTRFASRKYREYYPKDRSQLNFLAKLTLKRKK